MQDDGRRGRAEVRHRVARHPDERHRVRADRDEQGRERRGGEPDAHEHDRPREHRHGHDPAAAHDPHARPRVGVQEPDRVGHGPDEQHVHEREALQPGVEPQHLDAERQRGERADGPPARGVQRAAQERGEHHEAEVDGEEPQELRRERRERAHGVPRQARREQQADRDGPRPDEHAHGAQQPRQAPPGEAQAGREVGGDARAGHDPARTRAAGGRSAVGPGPHPVRGRRPGREEQQREDLEHPRDRPAGAVRERVADVQVLPVPRRVGHEPVRREDAQGGDGAHGVDEHVARRPARSALGGGDRGGARGRGAVRRRTARPVGRRAWAGGRGAGPRRRAGRGRRRREDGHGMLQGRRSGAVARCSPVSKHPVRPGTGGSPGLAAAGHPAGTGVVPRAQTLR